MNRFNSNRATQGLAATRTRLGLTQQAFAMELGISRSLISMAERRNRSLPMAALAKLAALEIAMAATATARAGTAYQPAGKQEAWMQQQGDPALEYKARETRAKATLLQHKLDLMIIRHRAYSQGLAQVEKLQEAEATRGSLFTPGHLQCLHWTLSLKVNRNGLPAQATLRHKIALLHTEARLHEINARLHTG